MPRLAPWTLPPNLAERVGTVAAIANGTLICVIVGDIIVAVFSVVF